MESAASTTPTASATIVAGTPTDKPEKSEKPAKQKGKRSRKNAAKDKPIKIKLTTRDNSGVATTTGRAAAAAVAVASGSGSGGSGHQSTMSGSEDEDEPEAAIEEHLILRLPQGETCERLRESVRKREVPDDVKLTMKDSRRGYFWIGGRKYDTTLMDLPTIIESQKTFDKKQFYKIADISQMLLVDDGTTPSEEANSRVSSSDPYMFQHGLTPPLKYVRRRRFRKKLSKRAIEEVEQEVERLLEVDAQAEDVQYEVFDNRELEMENESDGGTLDIDMSEPPESESDDDLAAAIDRDLEELDEDDREDEDNEDEDEEDEDSDEEEDEDERGDTGEIEQKRQEIAEIKQAIQRKSDNLKTAPNAMLKVKKKRWTVLMGKSKLTKHTFLYV
ncbi:TAFII55 protein conserved region-domain-containing protein [Zychaea mexicana]|uniref:TAFII55 protein conserved region-domain-containing protein n=1 Tax=Zychaea mexicana TaxID=64656 RepID=UPI0022FE3776|nr:TAFII55 protein conserved region-domain-containing protein [Zychaea mexicana]KAI9493420.1 TAFII55 protein conserved region-domain-containing protein [Zychaea mexicana]